MVDRFRAVREMVTAEGAAKRYGMEFDCSGRARCCFHGPDRHPSMTFKGGRFKCWSCGACGDSVDLVAKLRGLSPMGALRQINDDFALGLPLDRKPTPEEERATRKRKEVAETHRAFEAWRNDTINALNRCVLVANEGLKKAGSLDDLTTTEVKAIQHREQAEDLADTLARGTADGQVKIFRERGSAFKWIEQILNRTPTR